MTRITPQAAARFELNRLYSAAEYLESAAIALDELNRSEEASELVYKATRLRREATSIRKHRLQENA